MRSIEVNGVTLAVDDRGDGDPVVLLHGFPELAYSWRHQIPALVDAGFRVISFDQRGYGSSGKPDSVTDYSLEHLAGDVIGVLDRLGIEEAAVVGHDWGSIVAWTAAVAHPDRVTRVVSLNVPYRGACFGFPTTQVIADQLADRFGYVLMFQEEGAAEAGFAADPEGWLMAFYSGGARGRTYMTDEEFTTYADAFKAGGITGPVNWYRNIDANAAALESTLDALIVQPTLMIAADNDPVLPLSLTEGMQRWIPDLDVVVIEDSGHWTQQEQPDAVNKALIEWLTRTT
ncbi:Epoxide hydrolase [hydrothermal vent metagenome]|uniref:Epoxide hydrolase n=1 Tax=hydrothermal vent metagenome TaxID=652676 RepID=A0A3B0SL53_9ZZZZ